MHVRYKRTILLAWAARCPVVTQIFVHVMWDSEAQTTAHGPGGRALRTQYLLGRYARASMWCWNAPGRTEPLHMLLESMRAIQQRIKRLSAKM